MIPRYKFLLLITFIVFAAGCASDQQTLSNDQDNAVQVAARRGQFEMSCAQATGTVLSNNVLQPVVWGGNERAEYTVGVAGCGQKRTYIVVCQVGSVSCVAGASPENPTITQ